ncbi:DUF6418 domain-containing protein [Gordonia amicalis]|uniref:DUF6418 domain-containing protein n=1 Tax=Gordonia TaxID=2053 RepID=UPI0022B36654|nr:MULTISPECIES: DUF6418 domain-containing protein [Gordonia]MCZ4653822.1 DUF6418 domain-containing protein [Gordonia amicalis]WJG14456.1 DUF6418 domain-containing protein [Gordonia sp. Swx-4]
MGSKKVSRKAASRTVIALVASGLAAAGYKASTFADSTDYTGVADSGFDRFMYRAFALQGEVFWKTALLFGDSPQPNQMRNEFLVFSHRLPDTRSGIYTLMENLVPNYKGGPLFTLNAGYPAILVYIFGFGVFSLLACVVSGILFAAVVRLFVAELWRGSVVGIFGSYGLLYAIYLAFTMGGALYLGSWAAIASGALLVALYAWRHLTQTVPVHGETRSTVPSVDDPLAFETVDDRSGSFSAHPDNQ